MLYLSKSVMFILLISYGASYWSQDNTYNDEHVNSNQIISYKDYKQSVLSILSNLLSTPSLYYDGVRLPLRAVEIASFALFDSYLLRTGREPPHLCNEILLYGILSSFFLHALYDIRMIRKNHGTSLLFLPRFIAQTTEHIIFVVIVERVSVTLFYESFSFV